MNEFGETLGEHLRRLRRQRGLSLLEVESRSEQEFKASVLGAYERGERSISAARLARLAELYEVPLQGMLPSGPNTPAPAGSVAVDLARAEESDVPEARAVARFARTIVGRRGTWTERSVAIRAEDVAALAAALDRTPEELVRKLGELGVRAW